MRPELRNSLTRLPTNVAIAVLATVALLVGGMWATALADGHVALLARPNDGNHGPWRHHGTLRDLYEYVTLYAFAVAGPAAIVGWIVEGSRRSAVVAGLAGAAVLVNCLHFPLFD